MFHYEDCMYHRYRTDGYVIFRGILPWTLVRDLRREADKAREIAHRENGPQSQRIQPIFKYADRLNMKPFVDYLELPAIRDAVHKVLSPLHGHGTRDQMGLLIEPSRKAWHLGWHRDGVVELPEEAYDEPMREVVGKLIADEKVWNQVNCALYAESCTWYVPGSHLRVHDLPGEAQPWQRTKKVGPLNEFDPVEAESLAMEEVWSMPGAVQVQLQAGDYFLYRNLGWHTGNYLPYQPRATIHDAIAHPHAGESWNLWAEAKKAALERMNLRKK